MIYSYFLAHNLLYSMGSNNKGQLGLGDPSIVEKHAPILIETMIEKAPLDLACGDNHSLVLTRDGRVFAWGDNEFGQCGSTYTQREIYAPKSINQETLRTNNIIQIDCGADHSAIIDLNGFLYTFGRNDYGQLGTGSYINECIPLHIGRVLDVAQVQCGVDHTLVLNRRSEVFSMGLNTHGQLGLKNVRA